MNKCHQNINWQNDTTPAINETNLNYMDGCIDTIDDRVVAMDTSKANQSDLLTALSGVTYNTSTGVFTFTWKNGTTATFDLNIEKIPVSFSMDENGVITMITEDGTTYTADVSAILKTYSFTNSSTIGWTVTRNGNNFTVVADVIDGSITANKLQPNYLADVTAQAQAASAAATAASGSASDATDSAEDSEAWAVGQRGGVDVPSTDPAYHNNAKYWKEQAQEIAQQSLSGLSDVSITNPQDGDLLAYDADNSEWVNSGAVKNSLNDIYEKIGSKNLLPTTRTTTTVSGITFTVNADGSITASGIAVAGALFETHFFISNGSYQQGYSDIYGKSLILSGCPLAAGQAGCALAFGRIDNSGSEVSDTGNGVTFTYSKTSTSSNSYVGIWIPSGTNLSTPITFYPMLREASISDDTWQPYGQSKFAKHTDLTSIIATGSTNTTGATITKGTYFYLNGTLVMALADIASGANYTLNTNYETITAGALNKLDGLASGIITKNSAFVTSGTLDRTCCTRRGSVVNVGGRIHSINSGSVAALGTFFKIPEGFRPPQNIYVMGYMYIENFSPSLSVTMVEITTAGEVNFVFSSGLTTIQVGFAGTYTL